MIGSFKTLAAATLLAVSLGAGSALAQSVNTAAPAAPLTVVDKTSFDQEVLGADKPVIAIVVSADSCTTLEAMIEEAAKAHPEVKFVKSNGAEFGVPADKMPLLVTFAPAASRSAFFVKPAFTADKDTFDAFLKERIAAVTKANDAQKSIDAATAEMEKILPRWQELYANMKDSDKDERIALNEKLSALTRQMADGHRAIAEVIDAEQKAR